MTPHTAANPDERRQAEITRAEAYRDKLEAFAELTGQVVGAAFPAPAEMVKDWTAALIAIMTGPQDDLIHHLQSAPYYEPPPPPPFDPAELAALEAEREQLNQGLTRIERAERSQDPTVQAMSEMGFLDLLKAMMTKRLTQIGAEILEIQTFMEEKARASLAAKGDTVAPITAPLYPRGTPLSRYSNAAEL